MPTTRQPLDLGDLRDDGPDRAARGRDDDLFAILQRADFQQPAISGQAGAAQRMHIDAERQRRIALQHAQRGTGRDEAVAHPRPVADERALGERRIARFHDPPDTRAEHRLVQRLIGVEPRAHIGIDRQEQRLDLDLARRRLGQIRLDDLEILGHGNAIRAADQVDLAGFHCDRS